MKKYIALLVVLFVTGAGWWWYAAQSPDSSIVRIYGNIDLRSSKLTFIEQENVAAIFVDEGDAVLAGQPLAALDDRKLLAQKAELQARIQAQEAVVVKLQRGLRPQEIAQAQAEFHAAAVREQNARILYRRLQTSSRTGASTKQEFDDASTALQVAVAERKVQEKKVSLAREGFRKEDIAEAEATLNALRAQLHIVTIRIDDLTLRAPVDGIIQSRILELGEIASPAKIAFTLVVVSPKWVRAYIPEPLLGTVQEGMTVQVITDSSVTPFIGTVGNIASQAEFTPKRVETAELRTQLVYETRIWVDDPNNALKQGMPVTVEFEKQTARPETVRKGT